MDINNEYGVLQVQKDLLELLKELDHFCITNNIKYSVIGGTLLGAIRHKGFIPWDDDLDIIFDRNNYEKLKNALPYGKLKLSSNSKITLWIDRIIFSERIDSSKQQAFIDVFVLDNCPDNHIKASIKMLLIKVLQGMIKSRPEFGKRPILLLIMSYLLHCIGLFFSFDKKMSFYHCISAWGNDQPSKYRKIYNDEFRMLSKVYSADLLDSLNRFSFEDSEVYGIEKYDEYLAYIYGDYMTLPKENERCPMHRDISCGL